MPNSISIHRPFRRLRCGRELTRLIRDELQGDVGVLVNNVGVGNEDPFLVVDVDPELESNMIRINCEGTVKMTRAVIPFLASKRKGAIINISSASGTHPSPLLAVYSATKAFINQFSASVTYEYKEHGVDVLGVHPYYISSTGLYAAKKPTLNAPAPERIVQDTLACLGTGTVLAYPYRFHALMGWGFRTVVWDTGATILRIMKQSKARADSRTKKDT